MKEKTAMNKETEFVNSLISQMTIKEKIGQITMYIAGLDSYDRDNGKFTFRPHVKKQLEEYGIGIISTLLRADPWSQRTYGTGVELEEREAFVNQFQKYAIEHSRLGIPVLLDLEASHGMQALGSVMYPTNICTGCSFDTDLYGRMMKLIGKELRLSGNHIGFITVLDMCCDPRFGRTEESFGEDPLLTSRMAVSATKALDSENVSMCAKHFIAHGGADGAHMSGNASMGVREMKEIHLRPAKAAIDAGADLVMISYNSIDGISCVADKHLLTDILRGELDFKGIAMSDGTGVNTAKELVRDGADYRASALALNAGCDVSLGDCDGIFLHLDKALEEGLICEERLDEAVRRVLMLKVKRGLFDDPYLKPGRVAAFVKSGECQKTAYDVAASGMVLLKNENNILPLKSSQKIALIGPQADSIYHLLGDYTSPRKVGEMSTLREEMEKRFDKVTVADGYKFTGEKDGFGEALDAARQADVTVLLMGGSSVRDFNTKFNAAGTAVGVGDTFMDCGEGFDVASLDLPGSQVELLEELKALGKPIVTVLIQGRPYAIPEVSEKADAILAAWYPGQSGGKAITDMLLGDIEPSGRLCVSIPRGSEYISAAYNKYKSSTRLYTDNLPNAIYSFGYGLSYMPKKYSNLRIDGDYSLQDIADGKCYAVYVDVENLGNKPITETVCMYISASEQPVLRRIKELADFKRVTIQPGEKSTVELTLGKDALSYYNRVGEKKIGPGLFVVSSGVNPNDELKVELRIDGKEINVE